MDYTVLLESILPKMGNGFLKRLDWVEVWVKYVLAKVTVEEVLEAMSVFLDVVPNGVGHFVLDESHRKGAVRCWRAWNC